MSRVGKKPITLPSGVTITPGDGEIAVTGPKGTVNQSIPQGVTVDVKDGEVRVTIKGESRKARSFQGLVRSLVNNMVIGVSEGIHKVLEINGLGYKAEVEGNILVLNLGYSHPIRYEIPEGISVEVDKNNLVTIRGIDKQLVGQVAAEVRNMKKPEPYKGKGIRYVDERVRRKAGKAAGI